MNEKQTMERCYECIAKQCPKNNLNLCVKTEPVTAGADATVNVWFLGQIYVNKKPDIRKQKPDIRKQKPDIRKQKARHLPLHPFQPWKARVAQHQGN